MSERVSAEEFRRLAKRSGKPRKKASPEQAAAEKVDRAIHAQATRALKLAGFDPSAGYVLQKSTTGTCALYVVVPVGFHQGGRDGKRS